MRTALVALALSLVTPGQRLQGVSPAHAAPREMADSLVGAWNGRWTAPPGGAVEGAVELILARVPGGDLVLGQFTFITGGTSRTLRYEGRLRDGTLRFPLIGDGSIVLEQRPAGAADTLYGEWVDSRGALPAPQGLLELNRVR